jgi:hypothetical protein
VALPEEEIFSKNTECVVAALVFYTIYRTLLLASGMLIFTNFLNNNYGR